MIRVLNSIANRGIARGGWWSYCILVTSIAQAFVLITWTAGTTVLRLPSNSLIAGQ